jgi:hypothetical protein
MLIQRFAAVALGIMMGTSLLLQTGTVLAAKSEAYYTTQKISDYKKGEFAVLADDDVNFRSGPSTTADVLACLPRHSLLRLSGSKSGEWQKVEWNGKNGYIFAEYLEKPEAEELIDEDNSLGDWHLGQIFDSSAAKSLGKVKKESKDGSSQVYDFQQLQVKARRGNKKIVELMTASPVIYTMRGIGTGDDGARVIGQYGIPARVVYLKGDKDGAVIMYGYNFPNKLKQIKCKTVIIINNNYHYFAPYYSFAVSRSAFIQAPALFTVSANSLSITESATIPPPACI